MTERERTEFLSRHRTLSAEVISVLETLWEDNQRLRNTGHGHVWARPDGKTARCGGPAICQRCREDKMDLAGS